MEYMTYFTIDWPTRHGRVVSCSGCYGITKPIIENILCDVKCMNNMNETNSKDSYCKD